ncbi:MAG: cupredoxin domain-containing protein [Candidatus Pacearchaeota archaeon]
MVGSKTKTGIVIALILALLVFALLMFGSQKDVTGETVRDIPNDSEIEGIVIEMNSEGFSPSSLTINQGETVTFVNVGDGKYWPASDDHPTHDLYLGFDSKRGINPEEIWSFTFENVGEWNFHDHLNPQNTGTIIVTE